MFCFVFGSSRRSLSRKTESEQNKKGNCLHLSAKLSVAQTKNPFEMKITIESRREQKKVGQERKRQRASEKSRVNWVITKRYRA